MLVKPTPGLSQTMVSGKRKGFSYSPSQTQQVYIRNGPFKTLLLDESS